VRASTGSGTTLPELDGMHLTALIFNGQVYRADGNGRGFETSLAQVSAVTPIYRAGVLRGGRVHGYGMIEG
jgi:hypothetical protein